MPYLSDAELLQGVRDAISDIVSGGAIAEHRAGSIMLRRMSLDELMRLEQQLASRVARAERGTRALIRVGRPK